VPFEERNELLVWKSKSTLSVALCLVIGLAVLSPAALAESKTQITDYGPQPYALELEQLARINPNFRAAVWTGGHLQLTVMSIPGEVGLEVHDHLDQFFYIVEGKGNFFTGSAQDNVELKKEISTGFGLFVPAGTWHNIVNTGSTPLKLFTIYAPPNHPHGTIHKTKEIADAEEH
jgi:mannose-6-phosphate isomerase-like protein (cupin superfamily)